jgi:hypothetical protein
MALVLPLLPGEKLSGELPRQHVSGRAIDHLAVANISRRPPQLAQ